MFELLLIRHSHGSLILIELFSPDVVMVVHDAVYEKKTACLRRMSGNSNGEIEMLRVRWRGALLGLIGSSA